MANATPQAAPAAIPDVVSVASPVPFSGLRADPARKPASLSPVPRENVTGPAQHIARKILKIAVYAFGGYMAFILALIVLYRFVNPPMSSLMLQQRIFGQDVIQDWVAVENISPQIVRAVLLSEDGRFCQHHGIDILEMQAAIERAQDGIPRGASTISMQVIKNLFLWPSKNYIRKAIEIPLTLAMELLWPKRRIMEVYLNIAEWGPGIFGVEAASRFHFDKAANRLNEREAAQLAVALPNPYSRDPGDPGPRTARLAGDIQGRMRGASPSQTACVLTSRRGG
jgi:monofunctional biosynthetic peptidoglycan transglycosylase